MATQYLHGVEVLEVPTGLRPIAPSGVTAIGLVGTSYGVAHDDLALITGLAAAKAKYSEEGTILNAIEAIYSQGATPPIAVVQAMDPATDVTAAADEKIVWGAVGDTVSLAHSRVSGLAVRTAAGTGGDALVEGTDWSLDADAGTLTVLSVADASEGDTVYAAYSWQDISQVTASEVVAAAARLADAQPVLNVSPEILIAPGFTEAASKDADEAIEGAPGATGLAALATRLRAVVVADGPGTTRTDAIAFRNAIDSRRVTVVDPKVQILDSAGAKVTRPASGYVAGLMARSDADPERGWWASPSNQPLLGLAGTSRAVGFILGDASSEANALNDAEVTTIIRQNGWRLWGGLTCSSDRKWRFVSVVRTADRINRALLEAHLWAVDRGITRTYVSEVVEAVNAFLRSLIAQGAIVGGQSWADDELNTAESVQAGRVFINFDFTPAYPAERVTFRSAITDRYVETIFS